ncbi:MAG: PSD1 and planctomycete cytochrome C domain-containing protein [Gemmataceae bacterium]
MPRIVVWMIGLLLPAASQAAAPPPSVDYSRDIKPLLRERCYACHGSLQQKAGLRLDTVALALQGGDSGPALIAGNVHDSAILERIVSKVPSRLMPPEGSPLTPEQVAAIRVWIQQGAKAPPGERPEADPRDHWAFRKPSRPPIPAGEAVNPIDRFLAQKWREHHLQPAPPADRATLIRRVYLDVIGLPPTREELRTHLADTAPGAHERLVDHLLASPRYGERWGRHWMDVWRYSDWYGRRSVPDVLNSYGMIWRWRDWIVRSLNEDRPYDRMVQEMLAADELCPTDKDNLPATGFLVRNFFRWNYNQWMRDNIEHTGKAFLGLTLQCAQCHDHKYDPISQKEYFQFRAFFEPIELRHDRVPGEADPGPFPKYSYGASYQPITSGMIRIFDEKPDAETFIYSRGDERNRVAGKPAVKPGGLSWLGGDKLAIRAVDLPPEAYYPGILPFVQEEEETSRLKKLDLARGKLHSARQNRESLEKGAVDPNLAAGLLPKLRLARAGEVVAIAEVEAAESEWLALRARVAADRVKFGKAPGDRAALTRAAARAEKLAAWKASLAVLVQQEQNLSIYLSDGPEKEIAPTEKRLADLRKNAETARVAIAKAGDTYTPLSPVYPSRSSGRRLALAQWITRPDNHLTARVAVNHVWNWHFGRPLVESTANFGRNGSSPTHPELLDWLACELMANGWKFKALHRRILTSDAYRMASHHPSDVVNRDRDPDNRLLWRFPIQRMEAEVVRDSMLHVSGELDLTLGGKEIEQEQGMAVPRRSLYFSHHGETRMAFLDLFDAANPGDCYRRASSVRPQQALAMANSELTLRMARRLAGRMKAIADDSAFVRAAFEQVLAREPTPAEVALSAGFLSRQVELFRKTPPRAIAGTPTDDAPSLDPVGRARENLLAALMNHTDFVTLR